MNKMWCLATQTVCEEQYVVVEHENSKFFNEFLFKLFNRRKMSIWLSFKNFELYPSTSDTVTSVYATCKH